MMSPWTSVRRKRRPCPLRKETLGNGELACSLRLVEAVDLQGFELSPYATKLAEREGIDVGLIKKNLELSPRERIEQAQEVAAAILRVREVGKRMRDGH